MAIVCFATDSDNRYDVCDCRGVGHGGYVALVTIDPFGDDPLYAQLAAIIRDQIKAGKLKRHDRLPSEQTLVQEHGVSRDTVREAMRVLRDEGLVFTLGQRGSYVGPK